MQNKRYLLSLQESSIIIGPLTGISTAIFFIQILELELWRNKNAQVLTTTHRSGKFHKTIIGFMVH